MNIFLGVLIGLIVLMILITGHEFGHFIMARRNGVTVKEFGIGFPPRAIAWTKGPDGKWHKIPKANWHRPRKSLVFSLNWLPIGGFCQMEGESDADVKPGTFGSVSFWKKTKILFGGVTMNWLMAFIILTVLAATGMPKFIDNQFFVGSDLAIEPGTISIAEVIEGSPADKAGLQAEDIIEQVWSADESEVISPITDALDVIDFNKRHAGEVVNYQISRQCDASQATETNSTVKDCQTGGVYAIELTPDDGANYLLGVSIAQSGQTQYRATWSAPIVGAVTTVQLTGETFRGFGIIIYDFVSGAISQFSPDATVREQGRTQIGQAGDSFSGPVGILGTIFPSFVSTGATNTAFLAALISISLACMNVLPIPALDGGRWFLIAIYRIRGKKLEKDTEARIVSRAFIVLFALIIIITVLDVLRLFR